MNVKYGKQITLDEIEDIEIDIFLFANNVEKRKLKAYHSLNEKKKINSITSFSYPNSDVKKVKNIDNIRIQNHEQIIEFLDEKLSLLNKSSIIIFIDYSCMTKSWYYSILLFFVNKNLSFSNVKAYFSYTPSKFSKPLLPKPNTDIQPLPGKYVIPNNKPKALIVCLGYEQNKAQGIIDQLDPKITYVFYSEPALDNRFVQKIEENNKTIIEEYKNIIKFPFDNLLFIERELTSLYFLLRDDYNIIIAPLGPKPFTFVSMMMSIVYKDIDIWRVGSGFDINEYKREPFDEENFIISEVMFTKLK